MFLRPKVRHKDGKEHRREPPPHLRWTAMLCNKIRLPDQPPPRIAPDVIVETE
jgi:hypothetical protein